jgi:hypothetical protein
MTNLDYYLFEDHTARQRTALMGVLAGAILGVALQEFGFSLNVTAGVCVLAVGAVEITRAVIYEQPSHKYQKATVVLLRRYVMRSAFAGAVVALLSLLKIPSESMLIERIAELPSKELIAAATNPTEPKNQQQAIHILTEAKRSSTPLPRNTWIEAGHSFVMAADKDPGAWKTAQAFMEYRSHVNSLTFTFPATGVQPETTHFQIDPIPGKALPQVIAVNQGLPIAAAARFEKLGVPTNPDVKVGTEHLVASGGATSLDDMDIAHVVFFGVEVHYSGKPIRLEDVLFVNCTFVFDNDDRTRMLANTIINSEKVNFSS